MVAHPIFQTACHVVIIRINELQDAYVQRQRHEPDLSLLINHRRMLVGAARTMLPVYIVEYLVPAHSPTEELQPWLHAQVVHPSNTRSPLLFAAASSLSTHRATMPAFSSLRSTLTQIYPPKPGFTEKNVPAGSQRGRVFIVTGGNAGIGLELTKLLYAAGGTVYIASRSRVSPVGGRRIGRLDSLNPSSSSSRTKWKPLSRISQLNPTLPQPVDNSNSCIWI